MTPILRRFLASPVLLAVVLVASTSLAHAGMSAEQKAIYDATAAQAKAADPAFTAFSAERGRTLFHAKNTTGKATTPSCTTCHTEDPRKVGQTRAGKEIAPMAASVNPKRFTNPRDVAKWFKRNCKDVLGRECTALEQGDVLAYLLGL